MGSKEQHQQQQQNVQQALTQILIEYNVTIENGLSSEDVAQHREQSGEYNNTQNIVDPPIKCPQWICCLLPCINHVPSMKLYHSLLPDDTYVKRNGQYIRYDATALVPGDIIVLEEGDIIPADCIVLQFVPSNGNSNNNNNNNNNNNELLVDHRYVCECDDSDELDVDVNDEERTATTVSVQRYIDNDLNQPTTITTLYYGGRIILGSVIAIVIAIGNQTNLGQLIRNKNFPPKSKGARSRTTTSLYNPIDVHEDNDIEATTLPISQQRHHNISVNHDNHQVGVALLQRQSSRGSNSNTPQKLRQIE